MVTFRSRSKSPNYLGHLPASPAYRRARKGFEIEPQRRADDSHLVYAKCAAEKTSSSDSAKKTGAFDGRAIVCKKKDSE